MGVCVCAERKRFPTSAKTGDGIENAGRALIEKILENDEEYQGSRTGQNTVKLTDAPQPKPDEKCSC